MVRIISTMLAFVAAAAVPAAAQVSEVNPAQTYPVRPVRVLTGALGNTADMTARYLGQRLTERWGQAVVIDNRAGLAHLAAEITAKSQPNGYTLCMGEFSTHVSAPSLYKQLAYDPVRDFAPITMVVKAPLLFVAHPAIPAASLREFVNYAKKRPGDLKYATQSLRSAGNLTMKRFIHAAGIEMLHIPYKRSAESLAALLSGEADVSFLATPTALPHLKTGKLKIFAVTSAKRFAGAPDIPTVIESGVPGFEVGIWAGVFAPARTSQEVVDKLHRDITGIVKLPATQSAMLVQGAETAPTSPQELATFVATEITKWAQVIRVAGIKPE